jgi:hypothetical protein
VKAHRGGTYVCMEGPQFSTLAESHTYRQLRFDVIGMTNLTEAKLAREAELCYASFAMITDYDCWHPQHSSVTLDRDHREPESQHRKRAARHPSGDSRSLETPPRNCKCGKALAHAILTDRKAISGSRKEAPGADHRQVHFLRFAANHWAIFSTKFPSEDLDLCHLLVVGSMAFDAIETPFGKVDRTLGGAASYFALAASQFTPVRVVAIVGEDFTRKMNGRFQRPQDRPSGVEHAEGKASSGPAATART